MSNRQQGHPGVILEIHINNEYYVYAQILYTMELVFFDYRSEVPLKDLELLFDCKVLFIVRVGWNTITSGIWTIVGDLPIRKDLEKTPCTYFYDRREKYFLLYNPNTRSIKLSTMKECNGLEFQTTYSHESIEERIDCHYKGITPNWLTIQREVFE